MRQTLTDDFWGIHKNMNCAFPLSQLVLSIAIGIIHSTSLNIPHVGLCLFTDVRLLALKYLRIHKSYLRSIMEQT